MPSYTCTFCNKSYQRKTFYDRHIIGCELLHLSSKERQEKRDILNDIPPPLKMYEMILTLTKKVNEQEKVIEEFKKCIAKKQERIPVRKWLNTNITPPTTDFDKLFDIDDLVIDQKHLDKILDLGVVDFTTRVIKNILVYGLDIEKIFTEETDKKYQREESSAMISIARKDKVFYLYNQGEWTLQPKDRFAGICSSLFSKIFLTFNEWSKAKMIEDLEFLGSSSYSKPFHLINTPMNEKNKFKSIGTVRNKIFEFCKITLPAFVSEATETETKKVETTEEQPTQMETCE